MQGHVFYSAFFLLLVSLFNTDMFVFKRAFFAVDAQSLADCATITECQTAGAACGGFLASLAANPSNPSIPAGQADCVCSANTTSLITACGEKKCVAAVAGLAVVKTLCAVQNISQTCNASANCQTAKQACDGFLGNVTTEGQPLGTPSNATLGCLCSNSTLNAVSGCVKDKCALGLIWDGILKPACPLISCANSTACQNSTKACNGFLGDYIQGNNNGVPTLSQLTCLCQADYTASITGCAAACPYAEYVRKQLKDKCDVTATTGATATRTATLIPTTVLPTTTKTGGASKVLGGFLVLLALL